MHRNLVSIPDGWLFWYFFSDILCQLQNLEKKSLGGGGGGGGEIGGDKNLA